jgi:membrane protein
MWGSKLRVFRAYLYARSFVLQVDRSRTFGLAAELAFWLFFSLVPLLAVAGMIAAKLAVGRASLTGELLAAVPPQTRDLVAGQLAAVAAYNGRSVGAPAALVFVWMASSGVHAVFELLEVKSGATRSWYNRRLLAVGTCVALSIGVVLLALVATGVEWIEALLRGAVPWASPRGGAIEKAVRLALAFAASVGLVAGLYWIGIPRERRRTMPVLPGAVIAAGLHFVLGAAYVLYLAKVGIGGAYLAGLAVIAVTLMALYIFAVALLLGAQLNCTLADRRRSAARPKGG